MCTHIRIQTSSRGLLLCVHEPYDHEIYIYHDVDPRPPSTLLAKSCWHERGTILVLMNQVLGVPLVLELKW